MSSEGSLVFNLAGTDWMMYQASEEFINRIQAARWAGYGFVPFIGAGFSAPSGAPLVWELKSYLQRCMALSLVKERSGLRKEDTWHPWTDQWPPFIDRKRRQDDPDQWPNEILLEIFNLGKRREKPKEELAILAEGYGAAAEWRTSLLFLSRLKHEPRGAALSNGSVPKLAAPRQEIIDACLREVLKNIHPALGHRMLAVLAGALRLDLLLTTNFDDLLERAFADARNPLEVFEVHLGDGLPHWSAVSEVKSLVKVHGNRHSLRADYSLDTVPSEQDKQRFLEYLLSGKGRSDWAANQNQTGLDFQNHLLVMGVSGRDERSLAFIEYAWKHVKDEFQVFWLCFSEDDVETITDFTRKARKGHRPGWTGSIILRHNNFGLLLLQLYQTIRQNLPPLGSLFPSVSRLTVPPLPPRYKHPRLAGGHDPGIAAGSLGDEIRRLLEKFQASDEEALKLIVATSSDDVRGMTSACSKLFHEMESGSICLWLDMNDISSADNLFEVLLEAAYFRLGQENWIPFYRETDKDKRPKEIAHLVNSVNKPWVIFLNARETPGANTAEVRGDALSLDRPHGWMDDREPQEGLSDRSCSTGGFVTLLQQLCGSKSHISVVLMCRNRDPRPELIKQLGEHDLLRHHIELKHVMREACAFPERKIVMDAIQWTNGDRYQQRFLHALVMMQRPRLLATIWGDAVSLDENEPSGLAVQRRTWLNELEGLGLLRRKAGGFIWLHSRCRQHIREVLRNPDAAAHTPAVRAILDRWNPKIEEPEIHTKLAAWYGKVLDASEAPAAVFEAVYHLCKAAESCLEQDPPELFSGCERLDSASSLLKTNTFLIQTHGYARGSCRRLEHIRDTLCIHILGRAAQSQKAKEPTPASGHGQAQRVETQLEDSVRRLRMTCTEVMRAIAREVGEDAKGYLRHRQFGKLYSGDAGQSLTEKQRNPTHGEHNISKKVFAGLFPDNNPDRIARGTAEWVRWWRWSGMLALASRSYEKAESDFKKALTCARNPGTYPESAQEVVAFRSDTKDANPRRSFTNATHVQELRVEELRVVEQYMELLLLRYSLEQRVISLNGTEAQTGGLHIAEPQKSLKKLDEIEKQIIAGQRLVSEVRSHDHSADSHHTISANWCECRLLIHQSILASRRFQLKRPADDENFHNRAMGILGDAEASLRISDPRRHRSELGMVELHRAEARLRAAEAVPIPAPTGLLSFSAMCRDLEVRRPDQNRQLQRDQIREEFLGKEGTTSSVPDALSVPAALRKAKSLVTDGVRFLNRAEPVLRERRRNVWWITWFFERQLRLIAMSVWASVFEIGTPIPFLGLEAAMARSDSLADRLLDDAMRMISVDAYRLATIVDAYGSCAKSLQIRLLLDNRRVKLDFRLESMCEKLRQALDELDEAEKRRDEPLPPVPVLRDKDKMDEQITKEYLPAVRDRGRLICEHLRLGI